MTTIRHDDERAHVYPEGGIGYEVHVSGIGWTVDTQPSGMIQRLAEAARNVLRGNPFAGFSEDEMNAEFDRIEAALEPRE